MDRNGLRGSINPIRIYCCKRVSAFLIDENMLEIGSTNETGREIPRYTQAVNDYQDQTIQATREITDNYIESQKQIINSLQSAGVPFAENTYGVF